ncbi:MAG TPA: DUF3187 family protein [Gemmatimonadales bacterium]|nr:DUF3187 family protein [Gemmatimonadales bacterium]
MRSTFVLPAYLFLLLLLASPEIGVAQGLPAFAPLNPVASSRSGVYFQPLNDQAGPRWHTGLAVDYASVIEYNQLDAADFVLDSEILRVSFAAWRNLGPRIFLQLGGSIGGAYSGFLDGFLDWYHGALGIRVSEREERPQDRFLYNIRLPDGRSIGHSSNAMFLGDLSAGVGIRHTPRLQSVVSVTLPTATGPRGYGKGVPSVALLNTLRAPVSPRLVYEGSVGVGLTPSHGPMSSFQRTTFLALSSGFRHRLWQNQGLYANLFYHSPYYHRTSLPALDRRELSLDFGWILVTRGGAEWRMGLTEDLEPGGPGVDLVFRVGRSF